MAQITGFLSPTCEICIIFLSSGFSHGPSSTITGIRGVDKQIESEKLRSVSPFFCITVPLSNLKKYVRRQNKIIQCQIQKNSAL